MDIMDRNKLLLYKEKNGVKDRVPLALTFSNKLPDVQKIVHHRLPVLYRSMKMKEVFDKPPMTSYRRDANLRDILVHSKHAKMFKDTPQLCQNKCAVCKHILLDQQYNCRGKDYHFTEKITCKSQNLVYGIKCIVCNAIVYVGETGTTVYERVQNHLSCIRTKKDNPVANHFNQFNHSNDSLQVVVLECIRKCDIHLRKIRESFWIQKLHTLYPDGLNHNMGIGDGTRSSKLK